MAAPGDASASIPALDGVAGKGNNSALRPASGMGHMVLDLACLGSLALLWLGSGNLLSSLEDFFAAVAMFPNMYTPQFDWIARPMNKAWAVAVMVTGIYFLLKTYVVEKNLMKDNAVDMAHKKYKAVKNLWAVALHGGGSALELCIGCFACGWPEMPIYTQIASVLAINNIITGFVLNPGVFGIKHLTVPGFAIFGVLRALEILRTLGPESLGCDYRNYPQAWILLQVGTVVRLLGFWILPFTSVDGRRGDLFTEPTMYSFNILVSGYLTVTFVYPPKLVFASLFVYAVWQNFQPPRIWSQRGLGRQRLGDHADADEIVSTHALQLKLLDSVTAEEVAKHGADTDCWCIIGDDVYDVTNFLPEHPGGKRAIMLFAGKDATEEFDMLHDRKVIKKYGIDQGTVKHTGKLSQTA